MAAGQALVIIAAQTADRNFWASTRELEEDELVGCWAGYGRWLVRSGPTDLGAWPRIHGYGEVPKIGGPKIIGFAFKHVQLTNLGGFFGPSF